MLTLKMHTTIRRNCLILAASGLGLVLATSPAAAQAPPEMPPEAGVWFDDTGDGAVEIMPCGRYLLCGRIVWLKNPLNSRGQPLTDGYNPDPSMRNRPICGLPILSNLRLMTDGSYDRGVVYDPKKGKQHEAKIRLVRADKLQLTGFALGRLLSKSFIWTRAPADLPRCELTDPTQAQPGRSRGDVAPGSRQAKSGPVSPRR